MEEVKKCFEIIGPSTLNVLEVPEKYKAIHEKSFYDSVARQRKKTIQQVENAKKEFERLVNQNTPSHHTPEHKIDEQTQQRLDYNHQSD